MKVTEQQERVIAQALRLPKPARSALVRRLLDTLDSTVDADAEAAWDAELSRRLDDVDAGRVKLVPWGEARRKILGSAPGRTRSTG